MDTLLLSLLPFLKVLFAFTIMLTGMRLRIELGLSILIGSCVMGLMFGVSPLKWLETGLLALTQEKLLFLVAIIGLILVLSDAMERSGQSKRLMESLAGYLKNPRLRLIFFPALIGMLPMPGGAVFSAPMVKSVSADMCISNTDRALINYWFRHLWDVCWPLYPGLILTVALADIPISTFISKTWPGPIIMLACGWIFFLRPSVLDAKKIQVVQPVHKSSGWHVFYEGLPLSLAILGAICLEGVIALFYPEVPFECGILIALLLGVSCVMAQNANLGIHSLCQVFLTRSLWSVIFVLVAIFIFKDVMHVAGVVQEMAHAVGGGAALFAASVFLPFLVGMVAGINVAFVGATFPLLLGLLSTLGLHDQCVPYLILATFSGFTGVMISPIHICFVVTCQYFECDLGRTWRQLVAPCIFLMLSGGALFFLSREAVFMTYSLSN